ncbi:MAG: glycosyltransferase family 2 protein [Actinobacteria bacterium]|nr:glycosyltransferase family 2 protein [Actinomycetota bacterium]
MAIKADTFIVLITYNSSDFIEKCIKSICDSDFKNWFLAILDNNSSDDTVKKIQQLKKERKSCILDDSNSRLIKLSKNIGFAAGVNYLVFDFLAKNATAEMPGIKYLILINPDLVLEKSSLANLVKALEKQNKAELIAGKTGAVGGIIYDYDKKQIQNAGGVLKDNFITFHLKNPPVQSEGKQPYAVDYTSGALMGMKMAHFKSLGGFDSGYRPLYFEELDLCLKLKKVSLLPKIAPDVFARHFEGASVKKFSSNFYKHYHKNRIRCAIINIGFTGFFTKFIPSEIKWLKEEATCDQKSAIFWAYFLNFLFFLYNLAVRIKNKKILSNFKISLKKLDI